MFNIVVAIIDMYETPNTAQQGVIQGSSLEIMGVVQYCVPHGYTANPMLRIGMSLVYAEDELEMSMYS